ncbi:MAG TPA: cation:proton antiporter [Chromatiales bacterium]|nr:cation:proton antiporter [Chromatiales bacterium]
MPEDKILYYLFLIFSGAAILATITLYARQAMIVAYILLGILLSPSALNLVPDIHLIQHFADIGIIFLLFLLGLNLHPQKLYKLFGHTLLITLVSSFLFAVTGFGFSLLTGFEITDAVLIGAAMMFSSTIIGLKLLPTTVLHHQYTGELIISILLLQDIIAIIILLFIPVKGLAEMSFNSLLVPFIALPGLVLFAHFLQKYVLSYLLLKYDTIQEYVFLLAIGWCLGIAELAKWLGLSAEIGAFIAGVAMAASPISTFIAERLKPLRDFFLILFFFALGATSQLEMLADVFIPALLLALIMLILKPVVFKQLMTRAGEPAELSAEVGIRLGQISEFSLLIAALAMMQGLMSERALSLIQASTLLTFIFSPYLIVFRYPTPISVNPDLRRD